MFGDCSANIPRLVADHRRIFAEHFSLQNIANGSWKISKQALKILGIGDMLPHEYHEFRLFAEGSVIPPEHRLMLVNFHWECIGDAKKAQWDRGIIQSDILRSKNIPYLTLLFDFPESFIRTLCFRHEVFFYMLKAEWNLIRCSKVFFLVLVMTTRTGGEWTDDKDVMFQLGSLMRTLCFRSEV